MHGCLERLRISGVSKANCTAGIKGQDPAGGGAGGPSPAHSLPAAWESSGRTWWLGKRCGPLGVLLGSALVAFGMGGLCQLGSHVLRVFGSSLLCGVPLHLREHVWLERLDYHEARESLSGG